MVFFIVQPNPMPESTLTHRAPILSPLPLRVAKTVRNHLNEEITPPFPLGWASDFSQAVTILDMQRSCADVNSPYKRILRVFCSAEQSEFRRNKPFVPSIPSSAEKFVWRKLPTLAGFTKPEGKGKNGLNINRKWLVSLQKCQPYLGLLNQKGKGRTDLT